MQPDQATEGEYRVITHPRPGTDHYNSVSFYSDPNYSFTNSINGFDAGQRKMYLALLLGTLAGFSGMAAKLGAVGLTSLVPWLTADARLFLLFHTLL